MAVAPRYFGVWDYVVFGLVLLVFALIGVYSAFSGGRQRTTDEFLLGNRQMSIFPVALSIAVSFVSAITVMGTPAEVYIYDTMYVWLLVTISIANYLVARLFLPIFFRIRITSVYEYLELRFHRSVRIATMLLFWINTLIYMGIAMYAPALAISAVTGMNLWASILSTGAVCIFYTTIGGIKAVLWTDTMQAFVIIAGVIAVIVKGTMSVGGIEEVWTRADEGGRINFSQVDPDPRIVYSVWSLVFGLLFSNMHVGINQTTTQRLMACGTREKAGRALFLATIMKNAIIGLSVLSGVVMYAYYKDCDPLTQGYVQTTDQLMPYLVIELFESMPGMSGLFLSGVASAALSSLSSGINALAAVTVADVVSVIWPSLQPRTFTIITKLAVLVYGILAIGSAFVASMLGQSVLQLVISISGLIAGPSMGVFILGVFVPRSNSKGALAGLLTGVACGIWIKVGSVLYPSSRGRNALSVEGCPADPSPGYLPDDVTTLMSANLSLFSPSQPDPPPTPLIAELYAVSFAYYSLIGNITCLAVGILVSALTGFTDPKTVDSRLKNNLTDGLCCCMYEPFKRFLRCGADRWDDRDIEDEDVKVIDREEHPAIQKERSEDVIANYKNSFSNGIELTDVK